jgi:hypothetical protein
MARRGRSLAAGAADPFETDSANMTPSRSGLLMSCFVGLFQSGVLAGALIHSRLNPE